MTKIEDTIKALRCFTTLDHGCDESCAYRLKRRQDGIYNVCESQTVMRDAADALERMRWIPVEDETPPVGEVVFVSMGNMLAAGWYVGPDEWFNILSKKIENVAWTHWMHIPDGPQETSHD